MPASPRSPWNNEALEVRLVALYQNTEKGYSNSTMARILNEEFGLTLTRLSVLGRLYRLVHSGKKITARPGTFKVQRDEKSRLRAVASTERQKPSLIPLPVAAPIIEREIPKPIPQVCWPNQWVPIQHACGCMFPSDEKNEKDEHLFCNAPRRDGSSYCQEHHARVWMPAEGKKKPKKDEFAQRGWAA